MYEDKHTPLLSANLCAQQIMAASPWTNSRGGDRTHDPQVVSRTRYHYAMAPTKLKIGTNVPWLYLITISKIRKNPLWEKIFYSIFWYFTRGLRPCRLVYATAISISHIGYYYFDQLLLNIIKIQFP